MAEQPSVEEVHLRGIEKRYQPSRCYMFILQIRWSDSSEIVIYRSYSAFYELQIQLLDLFPAEGGAVDEKQRTIPFLPGRKIFQRSEVLKVAQERQAEIDTYCKGLIQLPKKISHHSLVIQFFRPTAEDISPPKTVTKKSELVTKILSTFFKGYRKKAERSQSEDVSDISGPLQCEQYVAVADYKSTNKSTVSFSAGEVLEVVDKNANGWWFVQLETRQGWAPASYLEPVDDSPDQDETEPCLGERFVSISAYKACFDDEVSFEVGVILEVMNKSLDGWWVVNYNGSVGHAPSTFLKPYENQHLQIKDRLQLPANDGPGTLQKTPPPRRCTIKNPKSRFTRKERDLTGYRKLSTRRKKNAAKKKPPVPDASHLEPLYENFDGFEGHCAVDGDEYLDPMGDVYEEIPYEEVLAREYCNSHISEDNYLNATDLIKPTDSDSEYEPMGDEGLYDDAVPFDDSAMSGDAHAKHSYVVDVVEDTTNVPCGLVKRLKNKINDKPSSPLQRQGSGSSGSGSGSFGSSGGSVGVNRRQESTDGNVSTNSPALKKNIVSETISSFSQSNNNRPPVKINSPPPKNQALGNRAVFETNKSANLTPAKKQWTPNKQNGSNSETPSWKSKSPGGNQKKEKTSTAKVDSKPVAKPRAYENPNTNGSNGKSTPAKKAPLTKRDSEKEILARSGNDPEISTCLNQKLVSKFLKEEVTAVTPSPVTKKPSNGTSSPRFGQTAGAKKAGAAKFVSPAGKVGGATSKVSTLPTAFNQKPKASPRADGNKTATLASRIAQFEK